MEDRRPACHNKEKRREMILVDIYVPSMDETYDFQLDENAEIEKIILEVVGIISKKTKRKYHIQQPPGIILIHWVANPHLPAVIFLRRFPY